MKCELCTMEGIRQVTTGGVVHYYCEHHFPKIEGYISPRITFKQLTPLLSIFLLVVVLTILTGYMLDDLSFMSLMMYLMSYFFLVFGVFKIFNLSAFADAYQSYDVVAKHSRTYALAYPFIEITLGILYFFWLGGLWRDVFTAGLMIIGTIGVWKALQNEDDIPCACLGMVFKVPMTKVTLVENVLMALMALWMVYAAVVGGMHM